MWKGKEDGLKMNSRHLMVLIFKIKNYLRSLLYSNQAHNQCIQTSFTPKTIPQVPRSLLFMVLLLLARPIRFLVLWNLDLRFCWAQQHYMQRCSDLPRAWRNRENQSQKIEARCFRKAKADAEDRVLPMLMRLFGSDSIPSQRQLFLHILAINSPVEGRGSNQIYFLML